MQLLILGLGGPEILLIVILALLLFGGKKIPELMSGVGKGVKSFRDGLNGISSADESKPADTTQQTQQQDSKPTEEQK